MDLLGSSRDTGGGWLWRSATALVVTDKRPAQQHTAASRSQQLAWSTPDSAPPVRRCCCELLPLTLAVISSVYLGTVS